MDAPQGKFTEAWAPQNGTGNAFKDGHRSAESLGSLEEMQDQDDGVSENLEARLTNISREAPIEGSKISEDDSLELGHPSSLP